jgi:hypothetical protein
MSWKCVFLDEWQAYKFLKYHSDSDIAAIFFLQIALIL